MKRSDVVVVTGAGSGIGLALARAVSKLGGTALACDVDVDALHALDDPALIIRAVDVRDEGKMRSVIETLSPTLTIVGLVTCAAIFERVPFLDLTESMWDATIDINLTGTLIACQAVLPRMRARRTGSIVMISSSLARTGSPTGAHYVATKGGVLGLARSLALEVAHDGIRVNIVSPGLTDTPQPRAHRGGAEAMAERARSIPLGRIGHPDDIVDAIAFLLSDESSYVTGQDIRVNGGSQIG